MTFKIDEVGFYKTTVGSKAFIYYFDKMIACGGIIGDYHHYAWDAYGICGAGIVPIDIIAKWESEVDEQFKIDGQGFYKTDKGNVIYINYIDYGRAKGKTSDGKEYSWDLKGRDFVSPPENIVKKLNNKGEESPEFVEVEQEKPKINLEVGRKYELNDGDILTCIANLKDFGFEKEDEYTFVLFHPSTGCYCYKQSGFFHEWKSHAMNIKSEYVEPKQPIKVEGWVNVSKTGDHQLLAANFIYSTKEAALEGRHKDVDYVATIFVSGTGEV